MNSTNNSPGSKSKKLRFSLVYKLNLKYILRLFLIFLSLDIFLCIALGASLIIHSESVLTRVVDQLDQSGLPTDREQDWAKTLGVSVTSLELEPKGQILFNAIKPLYPESTQMGKRSLIIKPSEEESFLKRSEAVAYRYEYGPLDFNSQNPAYRIDIELGNPLLYVKWLLVTVIILEVILLMGSIFPGARLIRRTLQPIADLAEATHSLNTSEPSFSIENMEILADKLDTINAARLDTRISLDETQYELKSLAEAINALLDRINQSYRAQIRFVSDASHELRTPISVIQGYANLLDRWGKHDEKTLQESIDAIKEETDNMKSLVEQLLFLARGDNNTMALQLESFDLSELASEVYKETEMIDSGHVYEYGFESVLIYADKALIKQALRILVDNAMKYSNPGGKILISVSSNTETKPDYAMLTVQDNGIGIPPEEVSQIFERFYRTDESRARASGGTGLGLSIAKWIAERHGGHMEVLSRQEIGTRISIAIPVTEIQNRND